MSSCVYLFLTLISGYVRKDPAVGTYTVPTCIIVAIIQMNVPLGSLLPQKSHVTPHQ